MAKYGTLRFHFTDSIAEKCRLFFREATTGDTIENVKVYFSRSDLKVIRIEKAERGIEID